MNKVAGILKLISLCALSPMVAAVGLYGQTPLADVESRVERELAKMTLRQKIGQLNQLDGRGDMEQLKVLIRNGETGSVMNVTDAAVCNELQRIAVEESASGIPLVFTRDVVHGFRTMLPIPLGLAATFDEELVEKGARMAAVEATENGVRWAFAPMMDISRDARWGRIAESFGEDTRLSSRMSVAVTRGYQGSDLADPSSMAACAKHFVGYGAAEGGRDYNSTNIPERQLRDVYFPPFRAAVGAGCASVMTSFNDNNSVPCSGDRRLLTDVLRGEWDFDGVVVSDWGAIGELIKHGVARNRAEAGAAAMNAGVDVDMSSKIYLQNLEALIADGAVSMARLDEAVRNVLRLKFRLGLFDRPYTAVNTAKKTAGAEHRRIAKETAEKSVVLLKNDGGILPLGRGAKNILVTGPLAHAPHDQLGTWTMDGDTAQTQTPAMALKAMYGREHNIEFVEGLAYSRDKDKSRFGDVRAAAAKADVVIAVLGEEAILSGEAHCLAELKLQGAQTELLEMLAATGKPVVTVVMAGRPLPLVRELELSGAMLYAFHPGTMGGPAIADIIFGRANPSGKLPVTFPQSAGQIPVYYNHNPTGRPPRDSHPKMEDIPVNARQSVLGHSSYYLDIGYKPLFAFGYGLSYADFGISEPRPAKTVFAAGETIVVEVDVTNTGAYEGTETVQLYVRDLHASIARPVKELKDFCRVTLKPGETRRALLSVAPEDLTFCGADNKMVFEPGEFLLMAGNSSRDEDLKSVVVTVK